MKNLSLLLLLLLTGANLFAQAPDAINYQAVVRNSTDQLVANTAMGVQVTILQGSASGTVTYRETFSLSSNANGLISFAIGTGTSTSGTYTAIDWSLKPYYIQIALDLLGGTSYLPYSTSELHSVPYALQAKTAESLTKPLTGGSGITIENDQVKLTDGLAGLNHVKVWEGTSWVNKAISVTSGSSGGNQPFSIRNPFLAMNYQISLYGIYPSRNGADPFYGEVMLFAGNFEVNGFAFCDGRLLNLQQNTVLYAVLGTSYGGNGINTFALPDLRGRSAIHYGQGPYLNRYEIGESGGKENITLLPGNMPSHSHSAVVTFTAP
ncbi:phage tail protein [Dyadobacter frigoris]|uniref:Phage tail collar domain-containing protein n=1 Tax=Dyadobacter frigoris TaxID=2576211 RepID=A0A4U6CQW2_9BACT|nr:tail fiber protein [Dyadobacter frigoris]TKT86536.1 hypothetical protein FDK13_32165 [Dyadobacter frigoris]